MTRQKPEVVRPVIAASATVTNPAGDPPVSVVGLLERALRALPAELLAAVDLVITPRGTWADTDPGRAALRRVVPATTARSVVTEIGVLQQTVVDRAFAAVADGEARAVLVMGGEAKYSTDRHGVPPDPDGSATDPDDVLAPSGDIVHPLEIARGVVTPVQQYALIESALAAECGRSIDAQAREMASMWSDGSREVIGRTDAWRRDAVSADDVLAATPRNPLMASPYRRAVVSSWTVDQAVAILVTPESTARSVGVADSDMVGLIASATSDHMVPLVARADLWRCPAISAGARAIRSATGRVPGDADLADLYSCFPSAVQVAARELDRDVANGWTVTGGMATYGGPFNSYALHAIAVMAERLRGAPPGTTGVTTCVSGLLTKAGVALWQTGAGPAVLLDVTADDARERTVLEVVDEADLDATTTRVVASTMVPSRSDDGALESIEILEDATRRRSLRR
jgi:acetyl-CoA C-acetyltransferase